MYTSIKVTSPFEGLSCMFRSFRGDVSDTHTCPSRQRGSCAKQRFAGSRAVIDERPKSPNEKRKRNGKFFSPVSREEKEQCKKIFSTFERRKRNGYSILKLQEEKEKVKTISPFREEKEKF